jgi:hypothetical protein
VSLNLRTMSQLKISSCVAKEDPYPTFLCQMFTSGVKIGGRAGRTSCTMLPASTCATAWQRQKRVNKLVMRHLLCPLVPASLVSKVTEKRNRSLGLPGRHLSLSTPPALPVTDGTYYIGTNFIRFHSHKDT